MLIVNKDYHDYYDGAMRYGIDKTIVYDRKTVKEIKGNFREVDDWLGAKTNNTHEIYCSRLGFCGDTYPLITVKFNDESTNIWTVEKWEEYLAEHELTSISSKYFTWSKNIAQPKVYKDYFNNPVKFNINTFFLHKCPVILSFKDGFILNPRLKNLDFQTVMGSYDTFQAIEQFISGVLGNTEKDTVEISDKDQLYKKGFDDRSFKKDPGQKKRGKKK